MGQRMKLDFKPELVDREEEFSELKDYFERAKEGEGSTVFVAGEAGIGKTRLVSELLDFVKTETDDLSMISGRCLSDSLEPLMPIREGLHEAGLSHLVSHRPPPKVLSAYLIDDAGILVAKAEREDTDLDSDVFSSMLSLVQNFVKDSLSMMGRKEKGELNTVGYGDYSILIRSLKGVSLATVIEGTKSELLIDDMKEKLSGQLETITEREDNVSDLDDVTKDLEWFIESGKYDGEHLVDEPELKKENLFENVLLGFQRLSEDKIVVLFLDDLQWADPSTLSLLHYLARNTTDEKVLILGTYRPEDITETSDGEPHQLVSPKREMKREGLLEDIELERLSEQDVEEFLQKLLGESDLEKDFLEFIYQESEGNPFFLLELTKMLVSEGYIQKREGVWRFVESLEDLHIPERVYEMVKRRIEKLNKEQKDILEYASVMGEEFKEDVVVEASDRNKMEVLKILSDIEKTSGLIRSIGKNYRFDHTKIREVLYDGMSETLRKAYHRIIAESYEGLYEDRLEQFLEDMVYHYYKGRDERAGEYLLRAAARAEDRYANEEAESFYENALEVTESEEERKEAYEGLGDVHKLIGEYERALEEYDEVLDMLAERDAQGSEDSYFSAVSTRMEGCQSSTHSVKDTRDTVRIGEVIGKKAKVYLEMGRYDECLECCEKGLDIVELEEGEGRLDLLGAKGRALLSKGKFDEAEEALKEEVETAEEIGDEKEVAGALHELGGVYWGQRKYDRALDLWEGALTIREDIGDEKGIANSLNNIALVYDGKGELNRALEHHEASLETFKKIGDKRNIGISLNNLAIVYDNKGDLERALEHYEKSLEMFKKIGDKSGIAMSLNNIAIVYKERGELDKALEHYSEGLKIRKDIGDKKGVAMSLTNLGILYHNKGELEKAFEYYEESLEIKREIGYKGGMVETLIGLSGLHRLKGNLRDGRETIEKCQEICSEIGDKRLSVQKDLELVHINIEEERYDEALQTLEKALKKAQEMGTKKEEGMMRRALGKIHRKRGETEKAEKELKRSRGILETSGMKIETPKADYEYGLLLKDNDEMKKAEEYISRALEAFEELGMELWVERCEEDLKELNV